MGNEVLDPTERKTTIANASKSTWGVCGTELVVPRGADVTIILGAPILELVTKDIGIKLHDQDVCVFRECLIEVIGKHELVVAGNSRKKLLREGTKLNFHIRFEDA